MKDDGLGNIPQDIRLQLAQSKERDDLAKQTGSWYGDYDYGKSDQIQAANGHYSDSGKLPWHPTFSTESSYSSPEFKGGTWTEDHGLNTMYNPNPKVTYTPSEDMIKAGTTNGLVQYIKTREPDVALRTPYGFVIDNDNIRMQTANEYLGYDESKYQQDPTKELNRIAILNKLVSNDKPLEDATGQFIPAAKIFNTRNIDYLKKGPDIIRVSENGIQKLGNEILDKTGYGNSIADIQTSNDNRIIDYNNSDFEIFKSISTGLGKLVPNKKEDFKTASIGIRD